MSTREPGVNQVIADILRGMRRRWEVQSEPGGAIRGGSKTPDLLIRENGALSLVIENEFTPANSVEADATGRLGLKLADGGQELRAVVALRTPQQAREIPQHQLQEWLRARPDFEYALYRRLRADDDLRWPASGWLRGSLADLALLAQQAMRPDEEIDELAAQLQTHISDAEVIFTQRYPPGGAEVAAMLADTLRLEDDKGRQARRMAMAMLANALIFQQSLAPGMAGIPTPSSMYMDDNLVQEATVRVWRAILKKNYFPIFFVAREILKWIDQPDVAEKILEKLYSFLTKLFRSDGAARSHDLTGFVFQRLIADRKFLATFYTRPESAALLAALALPLDRPPAGADWADAETLRALQVGDFACGTGTLLSAVYNRLAALHELHGGDAAALHRDMIEQALVGCDVLPMATHLTLSMLASAYPEIDFRDSKILTMRYGRQERKLGKAGEYDYALGSLDLLATQEALPTLATRPTAVEGMGESEAQERHYLPDNSFDLVIMNPPFTRPTNHGGKHKDIPNPAFAAFGADAVAQHELSTRVKKLGKGTPANGYAGMASHFLALADKKLRESGTLAMVIPLMFLSGKSWENARLLIRRNYGQIIVVTTAGESSGDKAFSADTDLGECLLIANKNVEKGDRKARFLTLRGRPRNVTEGEMVARRLHNLRSLRNLEDGPYGGTTIQIGDDEFAQCIEYQLPRSGPWQLAGVLDFSVTQSALQLSRGKLWLPKTQIVANIGIATLDQFGKMGPVHRLINGKKRDGYPTGPFEIHSPPVHPAPTYPSLWAHDAVRERHMEVEIDSEAIVRTSYGRNIQEEVYRKAEAIWATATRTHIATDFRYNSQSLCVAMAPVDCIGGRAWPSVIFPRERRATWEPAFAVWCNSTLGILLFWWQASRQQSGRGVTTITALPALPTLDLRALDDEQLAAAGRIFEDMKHCPMLPVNQIDEDPVRAELDRRLLSEVLGLPEDLCAPDGPMALLRRKLAAEPSIHGGKKGKVTLEVPDDCLPQ